MRMTLAAVVADESGAPIAGLTSKDFQLTENGKVQKILEVRDFDDPVAAQLHGLIVLDAINSSTSAIHRQRNELKKFLGGEIAIVIAANGGVIEGDASRDASSLMRDLDTRTKYLQGSDCSSAAPGADLESRMTETVATDAQGTSGSRSDCRREHFVQSMNALHQLLAGQADVPGRAILIWLGPGWPLPKERDSGQIMGKVGPAPSADMVVELYNDIRNGAACTVSPSQTSIGLSPVTITVTVTTTGAQSASTKTGGKLPGPARTGVTLCLLIGTAAIYRRKRLLRSYLLVVLLVLSFACVSCGGSGGTSGSGPGSSAPPPVPTTPAGNYVLNVTAAAGGAQNSYSLQLVVQ